MITQLLSTAVKLYLRSQVNPVEDLQVKIAGKNRQILQGYIPQVWLSCQRGVYQGLHLSQVEVTGTNIAFNLPEVLKKKPLRLLEPIIARVSLSLESEALDRSLDSPLLQSGLRDLWEIILPGEKQISTESIVWHDIAIAEEKLSLSGTYRDNQGENCKINLLTEIFLLEGHILCLSPLKLVNKSETIQLRDTVKIDLGTDVTIEQLVVESGQISCRGKITINT